MAKELELFSTSPCNEYSGLISFRINWFDFLVVQKTLKINFESLLMKDPSAGHEGYNDERDVQNVSNIMKENMK